MRVLVDTNVVLDVLLARQPFLGASAEVFGLVEHSRIDGFLCATTITTIDYLLTQTMSRPTARQALRKLQGFRHAALKILGPDELLASLPG